MRTPTIFLLLGLWALPAPAQQAASPVKTVVARVEYEQANEISGIVKSRTYEDVYWVHNDSGDQARLYALTGAGKIIFPAWRRGARPWPGHVIALAANYDWEDIALADGKLYILDMGNNGNARRDMGIYVLPEPNPRAVESSRVLAWYPVRYPDQKKYPAEKWEFDCEALFIDGGKPYVLTKHRVAGNIRQLQRGTKLYRLDTTHTDRQNVLTLVDRHAMLPGPTAADLSPNGKKLAVLTMFAVYVFDRPEKGDRWLSQGTGHWLALPMMRTKQAEAICWVDDQTLRLASEQRGVFELKLSALKPLVRRK